MLWATLLIYWLVRTIKSDFIGVYWKKHIMLYRLSYIPVNTENILKIFTYIEPLNIEQVA